MPPNRSDTTLWVVIGASTGALIGLAFIFSSPWWIIVGAAIGALVVGLVRFRVGLTGTSGAEAFDGAVVQVGGCLLQIAMSGCLGCALAASAVTVVSVKSVVAIRTRHAHHRHQRSKSGRLASRSGTWYEDVSHLGSPATLRQPRNIRYSNVAGGCVRLPFQTPSSSPAL